MSCFRSALRSGVGFVASRRPVFRGVRICAGGWKCYCGRRAKFHTPHIPSHFSGILFVHESRKKKTIVLFCGRSVSWVAVVAGGFFSVLKFCLFRLPQYGWFLCVVSLCAVSLVHHVEPMVLPFPAVSFFSTGVFWVVFQVFPLGTR